MTPGTGRAGAAAGGNSSGLRPTVSYTGIGTAAVQCMMKRHKTGLHNRTGSVRVPLKGRLVTLINLSSYPSAPAQATEPERCALQPAPLEFQVLPAVAPKLSEKRSQTAEARHRVHGVRFMAVMQGIAPKD